MTNLSGIKFSGSGYLHNIVHTPYGVIATIAVVGNFGNSGNEIMFLETRLTGELLNSSLLLEALRHQSIFIVFNAQYCGFGTHHVDRSDNSDIVTLQINQLEIQRCCVNGKQYDPLITST